MIAYRAISKSEFARCAGISLNELHRWIEQFHDEITATGQHFYAKTLNPAVVKLLSEHFCVETPNSYTVYGTK